MSTFYITTPIYYVNSKPHLGHAYTTIIADVMTRFHRLFGDESWFLTGTDEHGEKIVQSAQKQNVTEQNFTDQVSQEFKDAWAELNIKYDQFIRTTNTEHKEIVKKALQEIYDQNFVYKSEYEGFYCVGCERYLDDNDLNEAGECRDHLETPKKVSESNYFFKMSQFQDQLIQYIHDHPDWIYPEGYRNEVLGFLKEPLKDLCLSRPKKRLTWGVDIPFDQNYVAYVWFDALLNYVSALGWREDEAFKKFWPHTHHLLGKDIVKTHCVYWPCMLMALGIPLPKKIIVHGFWNVNASKMSKSLGNNVSPLDLKKEFSADSVRYFLTAAMSFGYDADFTEELFIEKYNSDLANTIGNLVSRTVTLTVKNFDGDLDYEIIWGDEEEKIQQELSSDLKNIYNDVEKFQLHKVAKTIIDMARKVNRYIDDHEPWKLAKNSDKKMELARVLSNQCACVSFITGAMSPIMPEISQKILEALGVADQEVNIGFFDWSKRQKIGKVKKIAPLFPRVMKAD